MKKIFCGLLTVSLVLGTLFVVACNQTQGEQAKSKTVVLTGLVDADEIDIATKVPGRVTEMFVREGDHVEKDQEIVKIANEEITAKIGQVSAAIEASEAKLAMARKGAREQEKEAARKLLQAARHQVGILRKSLRRMSDLLEKKAIPQAKYDEIEFRFNVARDQLAVAEAKVDIVETGAREEEIAALEALVRQAKAALDEVKAYEKESLQKAPLSAEVARVVLQVGELAATGYPIVTLVDLDNVWGTFAVRENYLKNIRVGTEVEVYIPALETNAKLAVFNISPMGDFATWKATSDKDSFDLRSFEVKARPVSPVDGLRPGMTMRWEIVQ